MYQYQISVVIPTYNVEKYLASCLDSVIGQTLIDIEIICINDGSTDNSGAILDQYARNDARIQAIHQNNQGVARTRNDGIRRATGEFIAFLDPDDYYPSDDVLECLYNSAKENEVLVCGGCFSLFREDQKLVTIYDNSYEAGYTFAESKLINYVDYQFDYGFHRFIYNRKFLLKNELFFPHIRRYEDPPFLVRTLHRAGKFFALSKIAYAYRADYKKALWNKDLVSELLTGLAFNDEFAKKHKLAHLRRYTLSRAGDHAKILQKDSFSLFVFFLRGCIKERRFLSVFSKLLWIYLFYVANTPDKKYKIIIILGLRIRIRKRKSIDR